MSDPQFNIREIGACPGCKIACSEQPRCAGCGWDLSMSEGIWQVCGPLSGNNRIASRFYDSPAWIRFRPWEFRFLTLVGGRRAARRQILDNLGAEPAGRILEVGIGDGENLEFLPERTEIFGVDVSIVQLRACLARFPRLKNRLAHAEAENLPFPDATFDASFSVGGFNYFSNPLRAFQELRRVTKPAGVVVVADERPDLKTWGIGHLVGWKTLDRFWLQGLGLPRDFAEVVLAADPKILDQVRHDNPGLRQLAIWRRLGYCLVDRVGHRTTGSGESECP